MNVPGSRRRVQKLVEEHYASLYRYAFRLSGSQADAEDLTQEAFCQAQLKLGQLREPASAKAWLFSILRNACLRRLRSARQEHLVSLDGVGDLPERSAEPLPCAIHVPEHARMTGSTAVTRPLAGRCTCTPLATCTWM